MGGQFLQFWEAALLKLWCFLPSCMDQEALIPLMCSFRSGHLPDSSCCSSPASLCPEPVEYTMCIVLLCEVCVSTFNISCSAQFPVCWLLIDCDFFVMVEQLLVMWLPGWLPGRSAKWSTCHWVVLTVWGLPHLWYLLSYTHLLTWVQRGCDVRDSMFLQSVLNIQCIFLSFLKITCMYLLLIKYTRECKCMYMYMQLTALCTIQ